MKYSDMIRLRRGDKVEDDTVLWVGRSNGGGVGMGDYPASVTVVLSSGEVQYADAWSGASHVIHGRLT